MRVPVTQHSLAEDFQLIIQEVPAPVRFIEQHWPVWPYRIPGFDGIWYSLTNSMFKWADKYHKQIIKTPITRADADALDPGFWSWIDEEDESGLEGIVERKRRGIDCTEDESVEILNYFSDNEAMWDDPWNVAVDPVIALFPLEWDQWHRDKEMK